MASGTRRPMFGIHRDPVGDTSNFQTTLTKSLFLEKKSSSDPSLPPNGVEIWVNDDKSLIYTTDDSVDIPIVIDGELVGQLVGFTADNTALGVGAGAPAKGESSSTVAIGKNALNVVSGFGNTAVGYQSMVGTTTGQNNTAIGKDTLFSNIDGNENVAVGSIALLNNTSGSTNTAVGSNALVNVTTGTNNTGLGFNSGIGLQSGSNNIIIGNNSLASGSQDNILIGNLINATHNNGILLNSKGLNMGSAANGEFAVETSTGSLRTNLQTQLTVPTPATPLGYLKANINTVDVAIPFYTPV